MLNKLEQLIKIVYRKYKRDLLETSHQIHPDEESMACFLEGKLSQEESEQIKLHLISCGRCAQVFLIQARLGVIEDKPISPELIARVKDLIKQEDKPPILEIFLRLKEKAWELLDTTGDVIVGQELVPAPILRSRKASDFKDEITILKDFQDIRVQVKIENKHGKAFSLNVMVKEKQTSELIKDLRVTLLKDDLEFESYLTDKGAVTFEHVLVGKYTVEISNVENKIASILLDIRR